MLSALYSMVLMTLKVLCQRCLRSCRQTSEVFCCCYFFLCTFSSFPSVIMLSFMENLSSSLLSDATPAQDPSMSNSSPTDGKHSGADADPPQEDIGGRSAKSAEFLGHSKNTSEVSSEFSDEFSSPCSSYSYPRWPASLLAGRPSPSAKKPGAYRYMSPADQPSGDEEIQLIKERFSKLLLGEDMSGSGKGVSSALAISNAITNLYASVFGGYHKLEPLHTEKKSMWRREMEFILSVCDHIVEFFPSSGILKDGTTIEVMATRPRHDIQINLPALEKLDDMLLEILDGFQKTEFWYLDEVKKETAGLTLASSLLLSPRDEEKWWLPVPCVPEFGISEPARKDLRQKHDCASQIHKAAMSINSSILAQMEIPASYIEALPKCGRTCVGDLIYRHLSFSEKFSPGFLLGSLDFNSELEALDVANRLEAAMHVWQRKATASHSKSPWSVLKDLVEADKNVALARRAESTLLSLKQLFPGMSQTALDTSKIQHNKDVGLAILESYSRVLEGLAFNIVACIDEVFHADKSSRNNEHLASQLGK